MGNSKKGGQFERDFCKDLSKWFTNGERIDVFWRTSGSGGMATARAKTGQGAFGQHGDIQAIDPIGQSLLDHVTFELKRGYPDCSIQRVIESKKNTLTKIEEFFLQASMQARSAKTPYWALVTKRDRRDPLIWMPKKLFFVLYVRSDGPEYFVTYHTPTEIIYGFPLKDFYKTTNPDLFKQGVK